MNGRWIAAAIGLMCCLAGARVRAADADAPVNFVVIFADDLGYGDLECYGHPEFRTPNLNRMAEEGARLTNFYVPVPYCAPSRGTLLTGRYPWRHGVWRNPAPDAPGGGINDVGLPDDEITIAETLRELGYATSCIGKWHLGHRPEFYPRRQGFDEYFGILYSNDMRPVELRENDDRCEYPVVQATLTRRYTERAIDFIERNRDRPFFLYLPHAMPHKPLACSEDYYQQSGNGLYADVMDELDWGIGQVLDRIAALGLDERTFVLFTSDNGPWFGGSTGGLRGMKGASWEGGLRVPAIFRCPGRMPAGQVIDTPCGTIDVLPTILTLAGASLPDRKLDGVDLLPTLTEGAALPERPLYSMRGNQLATVRDNRFKLHVPVTRDGFARFGDDWVDPRAPDGVTILAPYEQARPSAYPGVRTGDEPVEMMLFDLQNDPAEQHNVAAQHPDVVARLRAWYDEALAEFPPEIRPQR